MTSNQIRETFLEFFRSRQHAIVPSAPMVIKGDPTLMFTNAGMNQFKDVILGNAPVVTPRVADTQKCLRVSGKHNDLEEVGHDTYHHTMFEMLGNWSFGDYFKKEAIEWAWELLVDVLGLDPERLYATVYEGSAEDGVPFDAEAHDFWLAHLPEDRILKGNKKDNFWEMGDTGPCGPCSEIHVDIRSDEERAKVAGSQLVNRDNPLVIEIWNLVFMQFNRRANGSLEPLAMKHIDTGMGFERLCMVVQGKQSNYDTDVFQPIIQRIAELSGKKYGVAVTDDVAMRVVADHLRAISFSIADGQLPSNVKAGYVIRRILRRAVRYGYTYLGFTEPFIWKLVDVLAAQMGGQFPELRLQKELIEKVIQEEEASFLRTLATGINLLDGVIAKVKGAGQTVIGGEEAFVLYDTFGFPIDLTELIAREKGLGVELARFEKELAAQKERSRGAAAQEASDWVELVPIKESTFTGYDSLVETVRIARFRSVASKGKSHYQLILDRTPFYGNSGGQSGDSGYIESAGERIAITDTLKENGQTVHVAQQLPSDLSATFTAVVSVSKRSATAANHSATHLAHEALRAVLGTHVEQKGSLVTADNLRFDFSHFQKVSAEELREVERRVNKAIRANYPTEEERACHIDEARQKGAMMLFGEKYGDKVRVIKLGASVELCGGTHVGATGDIGLFRIVSEGAVSAGVRRIEAVTGERAEQMAYEAEDTLKQVQELMRSPRAVEAVEKLLAERDELAAEVQKVRKEQVAAAVAKLTAELGEPDENGMVIVRRVVDATPDFVKDVLHQLRGANGRLVAVVGTVAGGKPNLAVMLGEGIVAQGVNAGAVVREAAREMGGSGGGQPFLAMAGGKDPAGLERTMDKAIEIIKNMIK
ncbi:MAG: alanine--tRNA ligase [Rikenellaceae bacterium]|nr:alanine--tRNA ligase [Rikenellaceae bacterium]